MTGGSASSTIFIDQFGSGARHYSWPSNTAIIERYRRFTRSTKPQILSETPPPESRVYRSDRILPRWAEQTAQTIRSSIAYESRKDGRWLRPEAAIAANDFFREVADLLPGAPHLYPSSQGDVVAEFKAPYGTLTSIVSSSFVLLFAVVGDTEIERKILPTGDVRRELGSVMKPLLSGQYGDLAAEK